MRTNVIMTPPFSLGTFKVEHKTGLVDLRELFRLGNIYREKEGLPPMEMRTWIVREEVQEYARFLEGNGEKGIIKKKGRGGGTWVNLKIAISAAMALSPKFKDEVLNMFVQNRILAYRDESGDLYRDMNTALEMCAESVLGKPAHKGHYITLAKAIKKRIGVDDWNSCGPDALAMRCRIEDRLATMLKAGVVRDWDHLKELAEIV